jgi:hypothetical protein
MRAVHEKFGAALLTFFIRRGAHEQLLPRGEVVKRIAAVREVA